VTDARIRELEFQISHRHTDGSWGRMEERPAHHDAAEHDPERGWGLRRIFACTSCEEKVTLIPGEEGGLPERR
jgi:hypothetical protein